MKNVASNFDSSPTFQHGIRHKRPHVLHVIEATLGGTLRYLDTIITSTAELPFQFSLAYSTLRATPELESSLEKAHARGWRTFSPRHSRGSTVQATKPRFRWVQKAEAHP